MIFVKYETSMIRKVYFFLQVLLDLARVIFEEQNNLDNLIHKIMMHTMSLLQCERCQVMLIDDKSKVNYFCIVFKRLREEIILFLIILIVVCNGFM